MILKFPDTDIRSNGEIINPNRPWIKQDAELEFYNVPRPRKISFVATVQFADAPAGDYDLIPLKFIEMKGLVKNA